jgi:hypothetical protein
MSDKEKQIADAIKEAMPKMSDFDKGYLLGKVEQIAADHPAKSAEQDEAQKAE